LLKTPVKTQKLTPTKLVASPNTNSSFSPCLFLSKSPKPDRKQIENALGGGKDYLLNLAGRGKEKSYTAKESQKPSLCTFLKEKQKPKEIVENANVKEIDLSKTPKIPVNRKLKTNLKELENAGQCKPSKNVYNELPITPAFKQININKTNSIKNGINFSETNSTTTNQDVIMSTNEADYQIEPTLLTNDVEMLSIQDPEINNEKNELIFEQSDSDNEEEIVQNEGYLYKLTEANKMKKLWFKLLHKDLYYFKNENEKIHKGMHNLSGVFLKEEKPQVFGKVTFYAFSVVYPKKVRFYYVDNELEYKMWVEKLKSATGYANLTEIYDVKEKLGNGKFGLVRLGIHKITGKKVAIKIMSKKDMSTQDLELVRTEIEILKVCQHPNIIRLYEVFENIDYFYIIMEYCPGGDLFAYIEKRGFRLNEERACQIIHKICTAVFYIHSYGIAHRDLKPENVLMTSTNDDADIRLLDFGLSKIIGPGQNCTEPYGTLSYVAPEVLLEQPYTKAVDLWSIGVTTYLLIAGCLPFDHETSEREIARMTIHDPPPYRGSIWKRTSVEAKAFIDNLLQKDPTTRMDIKQVLEHPWIQKYCSKAADLRRKSKDLKTSTFQIYSSIEELTI